MAPYADVDSRVLFLLCKLMHQVLDRASLQHIDMGSSLPPPVTVVAPNLCEKEVVDNDGFLPHNRLLLKGSDLLSPHCLFEEGCNVHCHLWGVHGWGSCVLASYWDVDMASSAFSFHLVSCQPKAQHPKLLPVGATELAACKHWLDAAEW